MEPFVYNALPARVIFGWGTSNKVVDEMTRMGCSRALILTTPQQASYGNEMMEKLGELAVGVYSKATIHTPLEVTLDALNIVKECDADVCIAIGGGSTIGLGKALVLHSPTETKLKQIVIPTTYAGSEATPIIGQTSTDESGQLIKTTMKSEKVLPEVVIYDIDLTLTLPISMTITSGMNAIAHAVEALWSLDANPVISSLAVQGIDAIGKSLPILHKNPGDRKGRSGALFGAWTCGTCLGAVGMSLHHKLCHTLGGSFGMPHAETHTVMLPYAVAYNAPFASAAVEKVHAALSLDEDVSAAQGLYDLAKGAGAPYSLKQLGFKVEDLNTAAEIAVRAPYPNPAPIDKEKVLALLRHAFEGIRPA